jgi:hypothetical protein
LSALADRHEQAMRFTDAMHAKAPFAVASLFGKPDFSDFLMIAERQEPKRLDANSLRALLEMHNHGN